MSEQKHLWSGDWERYSTRPTSVAPVQPDPEPPPQEPPSGRSRRPTLTALAALVALLVVVGVVLALTLPGGGSSSKPARQTNAFIPRPFNGGGTGGAPLQQTTPQQQSTTPQQPSTTPQATATPTVAQQPTQVGPTYDWLGLQMSDTPAGVSVATVTIGGAADAAGVNPGDVITQVNSTQVGSIAQLQSAVKSIKLGTQIQLTLDRGSTPVTISATLTNLPKRQS